MNGADVLLSISGIAVTFGGFASVVTALRSLSGGRWAPEDSYRLGVMICNSVATVFLALLPIALHHSGLTAPVTWSCSSAVLGLYVGVSVPIFWRQRRALPPRTTLSPAVGWIVGLLAAAALALQLLNLIGSSAPAQIGPFLFGLLALLALSMVPFIRMVTAAPASDRNATS